MQLGNTVQVRGPAVAAAGRPVTRAPLVVLAALGLGAAPLAAQSAPSASQAPIPMGTTKGVPSVRLD